MIDKTLQTTVMAVFLSLEPVGSLYSVTTEINVNCPQICSAFLLVEKSRKRDKDTYFMFANHI